MNRLPARYQLPLVVGVSLVVVLLVVGAVLLAGGIGPTPTPAPPTASASASSSADPSTPEGAVRGFFEAFARGRRTDDPSLALALTTGEESSAYRSVEAFLLGQKEVGKASITTVLELENFSATTDGDRSTVAFDLTEGGYDISLDTGEPLESPEVLPTTRVIVELVLVDERWLVDSYESQL
jgi:hypothetical protein